jgi:hypothetical protein
MAIAIAAKPSWKTVLNTTWFPILTPIRLLQNSLQSIALPKLRCNVRQKIASYQQFGICPADLEPEGKVYNGETNVSL